MRLNNIFNHYGMQKDGSDSVIYLLCSLQKLAILYEPIYNEAST